MFKVIETSAPIISMPDDPSGGVARGGRTHAGNGPG